jgi:uncharacterized Zn finger protein (UPF0148 family)
MLQITKVDEDLKDFSCPHCGCPLEEISDYLGNITELKMCPECKKDIKVTMKEFREYTINVSKP